ncbi:hypothetical protein GCM10020331_002290 [Ectobacillus funiculus]
MIHFVKKVYKVKMETDIRKYCAPGRGSEAWKKLYNQRSAVERVNAYLKEFFQLKKMFDIEQESAQKSILTL